MILLAFAVFLVSLPAVVSFSQAGQARDADGAAASASPDADAVQRKTIKVAVFPFEIDVERQMGMGYADLQGTKAEHNRLRLATEKLKAMLSDSSAYDVIDLGGVQTEIAAAKPLFKCNGCVPDLAKAAGATKAFTGTVQKASANLINISIFLHDVESGAVEKSMAVSVRQNTDAAWLRGVRWLVRNRVKP